MRRMLLGISQEKLGQMLGLTFQQVQKYEKGVNRIGASRLLEISRVLDVPVQFFFEDAPSEKSGGKGGANPADASGTNSETQDTIDFVRSREGIELNRAFVSISEPRVRQSIIALVRDLADGEDA